uniref:Uncharacterized protein n=1 Tax=Leptobrachium leishanense TaxID=445787 RepID=A0A8C5QDE2_9ANUR
MSGVATKIIKERARAQGVGSSPENPVKYLDQGYQELRAQCLASGKLFEDDKFPADKSSLGKDEDVEVVWLRPSEITLKPQFIEGGATRDDIRQGKLGNCWFLSSVASLTLNENFLSLVVPSDQSYERDYAGIFHFKFWQCGEWVDVPVDDRLPTRDGKLRYVKSSDVTEFWSPLLEKAYAKVNRSYRALKSGFEEDGLQDLTGGFYEKIRIDRSGEELYKKIYDALQAKNLLNCSKTTPAGENIESVTAQNIVTGHAYSVTGAEEVLSGDKMVKLVRVRNPWGNKEWNGAWSDTSPEWNTVSKDVRDALCKVKDDGECWMSHEDYLRNFDRLKIVYVDLNLALGIGPQKWNLAEFHGSWKNGSSSGGSIDCDTYWINPQIHIKLEGTDSKSDSTKVFISMMQKDHRQRNADQGIKFDIGFNLYKLEDKDKAPFDKDFFSRKKPTASSPISNKREVCQCYELPAGQYLIVPYAKDCGTEGDFYIRVITENVPGALEATVVKKIDTFQPPIKDDEEAVKSILPEDSSELQENEDFELDAEALKIKLNTLFKKEISFTANAFSLKTCKQMIKLMDLDLTGTLNKKEFLKLWQRLKQLTSIFFFVDKNKSGNIDSTEMGIALHKAGFNLSATVKDLLVEKYATEDLSLTFDDFINCFIDLYTQFKMFDILDKDKSGTVTLNLSEHWLLRTLEISMIH